MHASAGKISALYKLYSQLTIAIESCLKEILSSCLIILHFLVVCKDQFDNFILCPSSGGHIYIVTASKSLCLPIVPSLVFTVSVPTALACIF